MSNRILAGRYELLEKIGDGGMAVVYKARCRLLNRYVAIKILKPQFAKDLKFIENFRRESQAAASLSHPNIVNVYDVGREGNIHYIVMELIEGYILSDMIKENGAMGWRRSVEITKQIASALSFAHKNHIIHRDVKPHNILITPDGTAKITDFGIARALNSATIVENTGTVMGSVHYFSPEQARGTYVDEKSDIYSLGIVLYEMLTGRVPFDAENPVAVALKHINEPMVPPSKLVQGIPPEVEAVGMKATDKIQVNRYASAGDMLRALEDAEFSINMSNSATLPGAAEPYETNKDDDAGHAIVLHYEDKELSAADNKKKNGEKKKPINKMTALAIAAALLLALPLSYFVASGLLGISFGGKSFDAPDLKGMTIEDAEDEVTKYDLTIEEEDQVFSYDYEEGEIASQSPKAGSSIKKGSVIRVSVSKGMKEGTVPNIEGKDFDSAVKVLEKYGFRQGDVTNEPSTLPKDIVISQSPKGGDEASPGTYVKIVVSSGSAVKAGVVPKIVGMTVDEAKEALEKAGLKPGTPTYGTSETYAKNEVMWQQYAADTELKEGDTVDFKVSRGSASSASQIPLVLDYSEAPNSVVWVTVTISDESGTHNAVTRVQRLRDDPADTIMLSGVGAGTVTVIFDDQIYMKKNVNFDTGELY